MGKSTRLSIDPRHGPGSARTHPATPMAMFTDAQQKYLAATWPDRTEAETRYNNLKQVYWQLRATWQQLAALGRAAATAGVPMLCAYLPDNAIGDARQAAQAALDALNAIDARINEVCGTNFIGTGREQTVPAASAELEQSLANAPK